MTYLPTKIYFLCQNPTFCDGKVCPGSGSGWIHIGFAPWIRIRIRIETNADPKWLKAFQSIPQTKRASILDLAATEDPDLYGESGSKSSSRRIHAK